MQATKTRTSKRNAVPATTVAATPANAATAAPTQLYGLNAKAAALAAAGTAAGNTLQRPAPGLGMAWRQPKHTAPNTRAVALATLVQAHGATFSHTQALATLATIKPVLGAGSPASYIKAFIKNGYFVPA
jgi:hypothetical protein